MDYIGPACRCSLTEVTGYSLTLAYDEVYLISIDDGVETNMITVQAVSLSNGDTVSMKVDGTTITIYLNDVVWAALGDGINDTTGTAGVYTNSVISSGYPGISGYGGGPNAAADDFYATEV